MQRLNNRLFRKLWAGVRGCSTYLIWWLAQAGDCVAQLILEPKYPLRNGGRLIVAQDRALREHQLLVGDTEHGCAGTACSAAWRPASCTYAFHTT